MLFFSFFLRPQWSRPLTKKPHQRMASQMPTLCLVVGVYSCSHSSIIIKSNSKLKIISSLIYLSICLAAIYLQYVKCLFNLCLLSCPFCATPFSHYSLNSLVCLVIVALQHACDSHVCSYYSVYGYFTWFFTLLFCQVFALILSPANVLTCVLG